MQGGVLRWCVSQFIIFITNSVWVFFFKTKKVIFIIIIISGLAHPTSMVSDDDRNYIMFKSNNS